MHSYQELEDIAKNHICADHPYAKLEVVWVGDRYRLYCDETHWADKLHRIMVPSDPYNQGVPQDPNIENALKRRNTMIHDKETRLPQENKVELTEAGKTALARKEEKAKEKEKQPLSLEEMWLSFKEQFPTGILLCRPFSDEERVLARVPFTVHAWLCEIFDSSSGWIIAEGRGYAYWAGAEADLVELPVNQWPWILAEKRAEEKALSKVVPLGI